VTSTRLDATDRARLNPSGLRLALAGMLLGLLYAAVSVYWGLGGTTLLDTVGGSLERGGRAGDLVVVLALWAAVVLKVIAAVLPLLAIYRLGGMRWQRLVWALAWIEAAVLVIYGLVLTTVGLMVQLGAHGAARGSWCSSGSSLPPHRPITELWPGTPTSGTRGSSSGDFWSPLHCCAHDTATRTRRNWTTIGNRRDLSALR